MIDLRLQLFLPAAATRGRQGCGETGQPAANEWLTSPLFEVARETQSTLSVPTPRNPWISLVPSGAQPMRVAIARRSQVSREIGEATRSRSHPLTITS